MSAKQGIIVWIWNNFKSSIKKRPSGTLIGKDHLGTAYFEIPADPQAGKRKPSRWFKPIDKEEFDQDLPPEWQAWLRFRRDNPPTQEEIDANMALAALKKINAKELEEIELKNKAPVSNTIESQDAKKAFPTYKEYELIPGKDKKGDFSG